MCNLSRFVPWQWFTRRLARRHGFPDPAELLARLRRFAEPSEVSEPLELLRAGAVFHARGLLNMRAIQHNLDWVWPFWAVRQFDPLSESFIPRAFSATHVNLTGRNWTAVGLPGCFEFPVVDPRGLVTPFLSGWSLDVWLLPADGEPLVPARLPAADQQLIMDPGPRVRTVSRRGGLALTTGTAVACDGEVVCRLEVDAVTDRPAVIAVSLRPCNPEGVSLIHTIAMAADGGSWTVNATARVIFSRVPAGHRLSDYRSGDVFLNPPGCGERRKVECPVGLATAVALFPVGPNMGEKITVEVPLGVPHPAPNVSAPALWEKGLADSCQLQVPDEHYMFLYAAAVRTLILLSPGEVYPGPSTYRRFWFRDAAFILHALLCLGLTARAEPPLERFFARQTRAGYFLSQEGEWDANGEVLWLLARFCRLTNRPPAASWLEPVRRAAGWLIDKRLPRTPDSPRAGLLPAGFSAEHLGLNDYYYWDDFWGVAGLRAAAFLLTQTGETERAGRFDAEAADLLACIDRSLEHAAARLGKPAMPAAPGRRLDAGAVGNLVAGYPLGLYAPADRRLLATTDYLMENCLVQGGFYQNMIHSGINPYLTLHLAQVLLRAGDPRYLALVETVAKLASPTGQWPEAILARTGGGCMGDGQHAWAAAEWVMMMRSLFVSEEQDALVLCPGIPATWLHGKGHIAFGPTATVFGMITVEITPGPPLVVAWEARWHGRAPRVIIGLPGRLPVTASPGVSSVCLKRD